MKTAPFVRFRTGFAQFVVIASVAVMATAIPNPSWAWVWSLRIAVNDLKFYPDQLFPALTYPVDYDAVAFPASFNDGPIQIPLGAEVTWVNRDRNPGDEGDEVTVIPHLIFVKDAAEAVVTQSTLLTSLGQGFTAHFDRAGEFAYGCLIHPKMRGTITVAPWKLELVEN